MAFMRIILLVAACLVSSQAVKLKLRGAQIQKRDIQAGPDCFSGIAKAIQSQLMKLLLADEYPIELSEAEYKELWSDAPPAKDAPVKHTPKPKNSQAKSSEPGITRAFANRVRDKAFQIMLGDEWPIEISEEEFDSGAWMQSSGTSNKSRQGSELPGMNTARRVFVRTLLPDEDVYTMDELEKMSQSKAKARNAQAPGSSAFATVIHRALSAALQMLLHPSERLTVVDEDAIHQDLLGAVFANADTDSDGFITIADLETFLKKNGNYKMDEQTSAAFRKADVDSDGKISQADFVRVFA